MTPAEVLRQEAIILEAQSRKPTPSCLVLRDVAADLRHVANTQEDLQEWKESAMKLLDQIDLQAIGKELGLTIGQDVSTQILPRIKALREALERLVRDSDFYHPDDKNSDGIKQARAALGKGAE